MTSSTAPGTNTAKVATELKVSESCWSRCKVPWWARVTLIVFRLKGAMARRGD